MKTLVCGLAVLMAAGESAVAAAVQAIYSLRINGKIAAVGNATYMWKVLRTIRSNTI